MDRRELVRVLRAEQVPDALYDIPGVHDVSLEPDAYYFLRPEPDGWVVGLRERSQDYDIRWFATEDAACRELRVKLTVSPPPLPGGGERAEEPPAKGEENREQAWRNFDRALREHPPEGGDPPDGGR